MRNLLVILLGAALITATGCTKTGPQGPQGPQGVKGATGNANVIGSDAITVTAWEASGTGYSATFTYDKITSNVANYGLVEVYKQYSDGSWTNLPDINSGVTTVFNFAANVFTIYVYNIDGSQATFPGTQVFRLVVIPSSYRMAYPHEDWKDYNRTMNILNGAEVAPAQ
ncbi:MAG: hypothetical protein EBZ77_05195 [Chitinophagia bacterium]|nr:hypothetical protein [Chitinophagia bacterium]